MYNIVSVLIKICQLNCVGIVKKYVVKIIKKIADKNENVKKFCKIEIPMR